MDMEEKSVPKQVAVIACFFMTLSYVAVLYAPTVIFRLPPPSSFKSLMVRRFVCVAVSSLVSVAVCALILPLRSWEVSHLLAVYGIRGDHMWQAVVLPLFLTSLMYAGSFVRKLLLWIDSWKESENRLGCFSFGYIYDCLNSVRNRVLSSASDVLTWRNLVVAPITEELVFRACMVPLLLCGGFRKYIVIILGPIFFSLGEMINSSLIAPVISCLNQVTHGWCWQLSCSGFFPKQSDCSLFSSLENQQSTFKSFYGDLYEAKLPIAKSFKDHRFPAWIHCGIWFICFISLSSNRTSSCTTSGS